MNFRFILALSLLFSGVCVSPALAVSLSPADDGFIYEFLGNFNTQTSGFPNFLASGETGTGHATRSALRFDVAGTGLTAAQVTAATLDLLVVNTEQTGFGASPTPAIPVPVDLYALGAGAWTELTLTAATMPPAGGQYASAVASSVGQIVSFDVTLLVKAWLNGDVTNNGLLLRGTAPVSSGPAFVVPVFSSAEGALSPLLTITAVPEPASVVLAISGAIAFLAVARGRKHRCGRKPAAQ